MKKRYLIFGILPLLLSCISNEGSKSLQDTSKKQLNIDTSSVDSTTAGYKKLFDATDKDRALTITSLKPFFNFNKDEFSSTTFVEPKSTPKYRNVNSVYCYFSEENKVATHLRFVLQYQSDDWLFIKELIFAIDGETFNFTPEKVNSDAKGDGIHEWTDDYVTPDLATILKKIAHSKTTKVKLNGSQYFDVRTITAKEKLNIKRTLELYSAMKGIQLTQ